MLLQRVTFDASEVQIFEAVQGWSKKNSVDAGDLYLVIFEVRLPRLTVDELLSLLLSGLMDHDLIHQAIILKNNSNALLARMFFKY